MPLQWKESLERRAYREAGHAVMSVLIRNGPTDRLVPFDRSLILASFQFVTVDGPSARWGEITAGLGSLITTAQVLSAGYVAERIRYRLLDPVFPPRDAAIQQALHLTSAYIEEYGGDALMMQQHDTMALELFHDLFEYVDEQRHIFWRSVERLAQQLLEMKVRSEERVFALVEESSAEEQQ